MNEQKNSGRSRRLSDILHIIFLLAVSAAAMLYLFLFRESGDRVKVTVDGELFGVYSLQDEITEDILTGADNENFNRLVISGGKAYVESASCPDGICAAHYPIFRGGESIVCLPNRVVITVISEDDAGVTDIVG